MCSQDDMVTFEEKLQKIDIFDHCTRERVNAKWRAYKLTNNTVFAWLLKDITKGLKDTVLGEPFLKKINLNCVIFQEKQKTTLQ